MFCTYTYSRYVCIHDPGHDNNHDNSRVFLKRDTALVKITLISLCMDLRNITVHLVDVVVTRPDVQKIRSERVNNAARAVAASAR